MDNHLPTLHKMHLDTVFRVGQLHFGSGHGASKTQAVSVSVWTAGFMRLEAELPCQTLSDGTIIKTVFCEDSLLSRADHEWVELGSPAVCLRQNLLKSECTPVYF